MGIRRESNAHRPTPSVGDIEYRLAIHRARRQHLELARDLQDLTRRLAGTEGPTTQGEARADIAGRLARLQIHLAEHFAEEERVGFVPNALQAAPRLTKRGQRILSQHDLLRVSLAGVVSVLNRETSNWQEVREDFKSFRVDLEEHERRENELIEEALMDDLGGGG